jgi:hypothetical protein
MKNYIFLFLMAFNLGLYAQVDNTMYGLYQILNPPSFQLASFDPLTGQISNIGSSVLSNAVNATGASLNPYNQSYSYQDEDSWLTLDLQNGTVLNDVMVSLPNTSGYFNNFIFNAADSNMYGLFSQVITDSITGAVSLDLRLATCDLSSGMVNLMSPNSVAESFTMSGCTIDPFLMVYYFHSEGKFVGVDLYNGQIYSQPTISINGSGSSFDNFAYSCADTTVYGLIMDNGVKALGKINPQTGVVNALPTLLNFDNYVMNSGGAIDPVNLIYYFQTIDTLGPKMVGLSLLDGSVASQSYISSNGDYFVMYRIQSECYGANPSRLNPMAFVQETNTFNVHVYPNPANDFINLNADIEINQVEIVNTNGTVVQYYHPHHTNIKIPIDSLSNGIYFLRIQSENTLQNYRFIKAN